MTTTLSKTLKRKAAWELFPGQLFILEKSGACVLFTVGRACLITRRRYL
jgi:hypothetical protein